MSFHNPAQSLFDVVDFFEKVDKKNSGDGIIWAKATAPRGAQVIVELQTAHGKRVKVPPVRPGDPVCLSKYATFEVLRDSPDLLQSANNGLIKLLTHAEANAFFEKKAKLLKTDAAALMQKADSSARSSIFQKKLETSQVDKSQRIEDTFVAEEDIVNPRLHNLCAQVQPMLKENEKMPVNEMMSEILDLEESLTLDDLEYLDANGYWPSVKKWAKSKKLEVAQAMGLLPETDALSDPA
jgi:hypothetical protein